MITKEQAEQAAEEILAYERKDLVEAKNSQARRVPWQYRVAGLTRLQPYEQEQFFQEAVTKSLSQPVYWAASIFWFVGIAALWYWLLWPSGTPLIVAAVIAAVGALVIRTTVVRSLLHGALEVKSGAHASARLDFPSSGLRPLDATTLRPPFLGHAWRSERGQAVPAGLRPCPTCRWPTGLPLPAVKVSPGPRWGYRAPRRQRGQ